MKKIRKLFFGAVIFLAVPFGVFGQETQENSRSNIEDDGVIVANVDFKNFQVVSQEGNNFKISFDISNGEKSQSKVKYSVIIVEKNGNAYESVDEKIFDEAINIANNQVINREVKYSAPDYLTGNYGLMLQSKNEAGLILALSSVKEVTLSGSGEYVHIGECSVSVSGDDDKYFFPNGGIDISEKEELMAECSIVNKMQRDVSLTAAFETRLRSDFGELVNDVAKKGESFVLKSGEQKDIKIKLPKASVPQSYNIKMELVEQEKGESVSNSVSFHYIISGASATIQNVSLDKSSYLKGEQAKIMFFWSGSADGFPDARLNNESETATKYSLAIVNSKGENCIDPIAGNLDEKNKFMEIVGKVVNDCDRPIVSAEIFDKKGNSLYALDYELGEKKVQIDETGDASDDLAILKKFLVAVFLMVFIAVIVTVLIKKRSSPKLIIFIFISGFLFFSNSDFASAITKCRYDLCAVANIDKGENGEYSPGEDVVTSASVFRQDCANYYYGGTYYGKLNTFGSWDTVGTFSNLTGKSIAFSDFIKKAPNTPNSYSMRYWVDGYQNCTSYSKKTGGHDCTKNKEAHISEFYIPFKVVESEVDGACGNRANIHGSNLNDWPLNSKYCSDGSESAKPDFPSSYGSSVSWICKGSDGGEDSDTCTAYKKYPVPDVDISADPISLVLNKEDGVISEKISSKNTYLSWSIENFSDACGGPGCTCVADGDWSGEKGTLGTDVAYSIGNYGTKTFTLKCKNSDSKLGGVEGSNSVDVKASCEVYQFNEPCELSCGPETYSIKKIKTNCEEEFVSGGYDCNNPPCPVGSEWIETRR